MKRLVWKWLLRLTLGMVVLAALLTLLIALTPQGRAGLQTLLFVAQVLEVPWKPQPWFTGEPVRREVTYPQPTGMGVADLYRILGDEKRAAVLIFLGANAAGRDDPDVVNLGNALARAGFVAMFHWSPTMALQHNIDPNELENLVWAFQYLRGQDFVDQERVGLGGFCVGASFALVAAADPRINAEVRFLNAFGPYYDAGDLLLQVASRSRFYQGQATPWEPDGLTRRVLANELIEALKDPQEQELLSRIFLEDQQLPPDDLAGMSGEARMVHQLLSGTTLEEAETLYRSLPARFRESMQRISPSAHLSGLKARVMVMHDRNDRLVPAVESRRLADALEGRGDLRYTEVLAFKHVRPSSSGGLWQLAKEGYKLYRHMYSIIRVAAG
jgi:acetyl esterase/lipase